MNLYILDEHGNPVPEPDIKKWGAWFETANRIIRRTGFTDQKVVISTVFLGLDMGFGGG